MHERKTLCGDLFCNLAAEQIACMEEGEPVHLSVGLAFPRNLAVFSSNPPSGERIVWICHTSSCDHVSASIREANRCSPTQSADNSVSNGPNQAIRKSSASKLPLATYQRLAKDVKRSLAPSPCPLRSRR